MKRCTKHSDIHFCAVCYYRNAVDKEITEYKVVSEYEKEVCECDQKCAHGRCYWRDAYYNLGIKAWRKRRLNFNSNI